MPTLTITVWNVQDYGNFATKTRGSYTALHNFIAWVVLRQQTDILFMLEMRNTGTPRLPNLRAALATRVPTTWYYDWIKGAYAAGAAAGPNTNITTSAQLDWTMSANREGYAVFFRDNAAKFAMTAAPPLGPGAAANTQSNGVQPAPVPGHIPAHALTLVAQGRPPVPPPALGAPPPPPPPAWSHPTVAYNPAAPPAWADLNFPPSFSGMHFRNAVRRPAYCVINLNIMGGAPINTLMPLLCYHAPSNAANANAPPSGTEASGFTRELYQVRNPAAGWAWLNNITRALACGDFNVDGNPAVLPVNRQLSYNAYTNAFAAGGATMTANVPLGANAPANDTAMSLTAGIGGPPILGGPSTAFRSAEFDNVFYRGVPPANVQNPPSGRIYDLITAVRPGGSLTGVPVTNYLPLVNAALVGKVMVAGRPVFPATGAPVYPQILNWANFWAGLNAGQFPDNRSAAEFIRLFVSDHLPITFRFAY